MLTPTRAAYALLRYAPQAAPITWRQLASAIGAFERKPNGGGLRAPFRIADTVDYSDGEQPLTSESRRP